MEKMQFTEDEKKLIADLLFRLKENFGDLLLPDDETKIRGLIHEALDSHHIQRNVFGLNPMLSSNRTDSHRGDWFET